MPEQLKYRSAICCIVVLLLLVGLGIGGYFLFRTKDDFRTQKSFGDTATLVQPKLLPKLMEGRISNMKVNKKPFTGMAAIQVFPEKLPEKPITHGRLNVPPPFQGKLQLKGLFELKQGDTKGGDLIPVLRGDLTKFIPCIKNNDVGVFIIDWDKTLTQREFVYVHDPSFVGIYASTYFKALNLKFPVDITVSVFCGYGRDIFSDPNPSASIKRLVNGLMEDCPKGCNGKGDCSYYGCKCDYPWASPDCVNKTRALVNIWERYSLFGPFIEFDEKAGLPKSPIPVIDALIKLEYKTNVLKDPNLVLSGNSETSRKNNMDMFKVFRVMHKLAKPGVKKDWDLYKKPKMHAGDRKTELIPEQNNYKYLYTAVSDLTKLDGSKDAMKRNLTGAFLKIGNLQQTQMMMAKIEHYKALKDYHNDFKENWPKYDCTVTGEKDFINNTFTYEFGLGIFNLLVSFFGGALLGILNTFMNQLLGLADSASASAADLENALMAIVGKVAKTSFKEFVKQWIEVIEAFMASEGNNDYKLLISNLFNKITLSDNLKKALQLGLTIDKVLKLTEILKRMDVFRDKVLGYYAECKSSSQMWRAEKGLCLATYNKTDHTFAELWQCECYNKNKKVCPDQKTCVDTQDKLNQNCGKCGVKCAPLQQCSSVAGQELCACPGDLDPYNVKTGPIKTCNGTCTDTRKDRNNCGACGSACTPNQYCADDIGQNKGRCVSCGVGKMNCAVNGVDTCISVTNDVNNCGSCGKKCPSGYSCQNGQCQGPPSKYTKCDQPDSQYPLGASIYTIPAPASIYYYTSGDCKTGNVVCNVADKEYGTNNVTYRQNILCSNLLCANKCKEYVGQAPPPDPPAQPNPQPGGYTPPPLPFLNPDVQQSTCQAIQQAANVKGKQLVAYSYPTGDCDGGEIRAYYYQSLGDGKSFIDQNGNIISIDVFCNINCVAYGQCTLGSDCGIPCTFSGKFGSLIDEKCVSYDTCEVLQSSGSKLFFMVV